MTKTSSANTRWEGDLQHGHGIVGLESGVGGEMQVDWRARTTGSDHTTTPEELIAGAHSACFSMALSKILADQGTPPDTLRTGAVVTFAEGDAGFRISSIVLRVVGTVPGMSVEEFAAAARTAKDDCPVSTALSDDIMVTVEARLS